MTKTVDPLFRAVCRFRAATTLVCAILLGFAGPASAQLALPATACDSAASNPDLHFPPGMPLEDGTKAFSYAPGDAPFVSASGGSITITVALTFAPGEDATIKLAALDETCGGPSSSGTVFSFTFGALTSPRNTIAIDATTGEVGLNGEMQKATLLAAPRYLFVDVWDGALPALHAARSYVIDLLDPRNPATQQ